MPIAPSFQGLRARLLAGFCAVALSVSLVAPAQAATLFDPQIPWRTLDTPHFRVNYDARHEAIAQRAAVFAEEAYAKVVPFLKSAPSDKTELTLLDHEDQVQGLALPYPNSQIYVYLTSPDQNMLTGRYESWLKQIILHEFTHAAQFEATGGLTAMVNKVLGRAIYPNFLQPWFLIEGLAVTAESRFTQGGRAKEGEYDMILRAAALENKLLSIDQASVFNYGGWPLGPSYIYGSYFYQYLIERYGEDAPSKISHAYGEWPWFGINKAIERALPGKNAYALWDELHAYLRDRAQRQLARIKQHPLTESQRLTATGRYHHHPAWTPDGKLVYAEFTDQRPAGLVLDPLDGKPSERYVKLYPQGSYSLAGGRYVYLSASREVGRFNTFADVYRYDTKEQRFDLLTDGKRALDPAVSPDGKHFIATLNGSGTNDLGLFDSGGTLLRRLTANKDGTQYSGATWSPDGEQVVVSAWKDGARDLYWFRPGETKPQPLWRDSAIDVHPKFSPDGQWLYFSSDRSGGVFNLFAYRLKDRKLFQVTNVVGGATEPAPSPDGKRLAFANYSAVGWDIHLMPVAPETWREVALDAATTYAPYSGEAVAAPPVPESEALPVLENPFPSQTYNPWHSFSPKTWYPVSYIDENGYMAGVNTVSNDVLMQHYAFVNAGWSFGGNRPYYALSYVNDQLPPTLSLSLVDIPANYAPGRRLDLWQRQTGGSVAATFPGMPSKLLDTYWIDGQSLTLGYSWLSVQNLGVRDRGTAAPLRPVPAELERAKGFPQAGQTNTLGITYQFADNYKPSFAISPEWGSVFGLSYEKAAPWLGGTAEFDRFSGDYRRYFGMPWRHHVLALRAAGGLNVGKRDGDYYLGGTGSTNLLTTVDRRHIGGVQSAPLRGYSVGTLSGNRMAMGSLEYRFPIAEIQRGLGTIPVYVTRVAGATFADAGWVGTDRLSPDMHLGVGAETRIGMSIISVATELRLGVARGTHPTDGTTQTYAELGISF
ncbi:PD40 domain-containing protein [bacterium]|nr:PD40 domain-containing protein [bacterium]